MLICILVLYNRGNCIMFLAITNIIWVVEVLKEGSAWCIIDFPLRTFHGTRPWQKMIFAVKHLNMQSKGKGRDLTEKCNAKKEGGVVIQ